MKKTNPPSSRRITIDHVLNQIPNPKLSTLKKHISNKSKRKQSKIHCHSPLPQALFPKPSSRNTKSNLSSSNENSSKQYKQHNKILRNSQEHQFHNPIPTQQHLRMINMIKRLDNLTLKYDKIIQDDQIMTSQQLSLKDRLQKIIKNQQGLLNSYKQQELDFIYMNLTYRKRESNNNIVLEKSKSSEKSIDQSTQISSSFDRGQKMETVNKRILIRSKSQPISRDVITYKSKLLVNGKEFKQA